MGFSATFSLSPIWWPHTSKQGEWIAITCMVNFAQPNLFGSERSEKSNQKLRNRRRRKSEVDSRTTHIQASGMASYQVEQQYATVCSYWPRLYSTYPLHLRMLLCTSSHSNDAALQSILLSPAPVCLNYQKPHEFYTCSRTRVCLPSPSKYFVFTV